MLTIYLKRTHSCGIQITDNVYILTAVARPGCYFGILLIIPVCVRFPLITNKKSHAHDFRNHDSHFFLFSLLTLSRQCALHCAILSASCRSTAEHRPPAITTTSTNTQAFAVLSMALICLYNFVRF